MNGLSNQRPNQVSDDVYGEKTLTSYLNRDAFAQPAFGSFGDSVRNGISGPAFWQINLAVSRLLRVTSTGTLELRVEAFNLFNNFNWGNPTTNFSSSRFGVIRSQAGDPRVLQFGIMYEY